jgi:DNA topoisomerase VI subunit B
MSAVERSARRRRPEPAFKPATFTTSRLAEFCTRRELERQTGHNVYAWPIYSVKELLDNAIDDAEATEIAPAVEIEVDAHRISVCDNGSGIPADTVERLLDLGSRTSSRSHIIAPTRGAQGHALSTLFVMPHALEPGCRCVVVIEAQDWRHHIVLHVDDLSGEPQLVHHLAAGAVKSGTKITIEWPQSASTILEDATDDFLPLAQAYLLTNPHLSLSLRTPAARFAAAALDPAWQKWRASAGSSPLWYDPETFARLIWGHLKDDREIGRKSPLREFLRQFDGLSGTSKRKTVLAAARLDRGYLTDLMREDTIDEARIAGLLRAMQAEVRSVKPARLGVIGEANLRHRIVEEWGGRAFRYAKALGFDDAGLPYAIEGAFAWMPQSHGRKLIFGTNFASSPSLSYSLNRWDTAEELLARRYTGAQEPICIFLHIVHPRLAFTDLGKTRIALHYPVGHELRGVIVKIIDAWERQRRREIKNAQAELKRLDALERQKKLSIKESVSKHLPAVYAKWAGSIGAVCRQLFYGLRPLVLADTGLQQLKDSYIQYTLIPDFIAEHPDLCAGWTVLYDDRGHLIEPHTSRSIGLGTRGVRDYCRAWGKPTAVGFTLDPPGISTRGPSGRYGAILFTEKEGFNELFGKYGLDARYDVALASTKGTSVTAARELFELAGRHDVPIFALVDFDYNGFEIAATLSRDTRRYQFAKPPTVIVIGLRLTNVKRFGLASEPVSFGKHDLGKIRKNLRLNGATEEEIEFLVDGKQRVEINAVPTPALIEMIKTAFLRHGVKKIIPDDEVLREYFTKEAEYHNAREAIEEAIDKARDGAAEITIPGDLKDRVEVYLRDHPTASWVAAVRTIAEQEDAR